MGRHTITSNTMTIILLQEKDSLLIASGSGVRALTGATLRSDEVPVTAAARQALERHWRGCVRRKARSPGASVLPASSETRPTTTSIWPSARRKRCWLRGSRS